MLVVTTFCEFARVLTLNHNYLFSSHLCSGSIFNSLPCQCCQSSVYPPSASCYIGWLPLLHQFKFICWGLMVGLPITCLWFLSIFIVVVPNPSYNPQNCKISSSLTYKPFYGFFFFCFRIVLSVLKPVGHMLYFYSDCNAPFSLI